MEPLTLSKMAKNEHYKTMNERFDERASELRAMGFKYQHIELYDIAIFVRRDPTKCNRNQSVQSSFVMCADSLLWADKMESLKS